MVFGAFFLVGGLALPWLGGPPGFDELVRVSGDIELVKRTPKTRYGDRKITIVLLGSGAFDAGFCHAGTEDLSAGSPITAWLDGEPRAGAANARAWQIHSGDVVLCEYAAVIEAARRATANAGVMGGTFALVGVCLLSIPYIAWRLQSSARVSP
jgi:hypothetical protein